MTEPHRSDPDLVLLHTLRCIGVSGASRVATAAGLDPSLAVAHLRDLKERGLVESDGGPFGGWSLNDHGRAIASSLLSEELETSGARDQIEQSYRSFLGLNPELLAICSDWQMRRIGASPVLNDHTDPDYDAKVLSRVMRVDDEIETVCTGLESRLTRFGDYRSRFRTALKRVLAGEHRYLADEIESYHTVWFQLHEDLLLTLGISREDERTDF